MAKYKITGRETGQLQFLMADLREQLLPGSFEWALNEIADKRLGFSAFDAEFKNDGEGRPALNPRALLKLTLFGYSKGILSSRRIERLCRGNIVAAALAGEGGADHSTIAKFISGHGGQIKKLFAETFLYCSELGLIGGEMFAADGCRLPSNASKEWSGTTEKLKNKKAKFEEHAEKLLAAHRSFDENEDRGHMAQERARVEKAALKLKRKADRIGGFLETEKAKAGGKESGRVGISGKEIQSNVTDNESAKIKGPHGIIQGYSGIAAADAEAGVIVAAEAFGTDCEGGAFPGMPGNLKEALHEISANGTQQEAKPLLLADTNYFSEENLKAAQERDVDVIIPDPHFRERDGRFSERPGHTKKADKKFDIDDFAYDETDNSYICPAGKKMTFRGRTGLRHNRVAKRWPAKEGECAGCPLMGKCMSPRGGKKPHRTLYLTEENEEWLSEKMRRRIDSPEGKELYSKRMGIIEPCFANMEYCKGMNRFTLRTKQKVNAQWLMFCLVHNIGKCAPRMTAAAISS
jgi:transposase